MENGALTVRLSPTGGGAHDTKEAALNGLDIEMGSYTNGLTSESEFRYDDYFLADPYLDMLKSGEVPMSTVDDKARNILRLIFRTSMNTSKPFGSKCTPEHYAAAKAIGDESIVLLKTQGFSLLMAISIIAFWLWVKMLPAV